MNELETINCIGDKGKGRAVVLLCEPGVYNDFAQALFESLSTRTRVILCHCPAVNDDNWANYTTALKNLLAELAVRQASFVGFEAACTLIQNLTLDEPRLARTLVLVDAAVRPHPSFVTRLVSRIEKSLPLGLPLRSTFSGFDGQSFLHRIRCPVMVVVSKRTTPYLLNQAQRISAGLPTGWQVRLTQNNEVEELKSLVLEFQDIPAKCPQKNLEAVG